MLVAGLLAACAATTPQCPAAGLRDDDAERIYVVRHRWHTGIILPAERVREEMEFIPEYFDEANEWYKFGWGDDGFYPDPSIRPWSIVRALFWPTDSVLHVVGKQWHPKHYAASDLKSLPMEPQAQRRLIRAIGEQFEREGDGQVRRVADGLYLDSAFFAAEGTFWAGRTCNSWTGQMLRQADVPVRGASSLTSGSIMRQLGGLEGVCRER